MNILELDHAFSVEPSKNESPKHLRDQPLSSSLRNSDHYLVEVSDHERSRDWYVCILELYVPNRHVGAWSRFHCPQGGWAMVYHMFKTSFLLSIHGPSARQCGSAKLKKLEAFGKYGLDSVDLVK